MYIARIEQAIVLKSMPQYIRFLLSSGRVIDIDLALLLLHCLKNLYKED